VAEAEGDGQLGAVVVDEPCNAGQGPPPDEHGQHDQGEDRGKGIGLAEPATGIGNPLEGFQEGDGHVQFLRTARGEVRQRRNQ
jgi:hypothetical protein